MFQDKYLFTVGYHQLEGKKVPLKKPLLVLRKKDPDRMDVESHLNIPETKSSNVELEVVGIIKQRILFKTRPKALISSILSKQYFVNFTVLQLNDIFLAKILASC
jgi:chromosome transmission fidelity protein 8